MAYLGRGIENLSDRVVLDSLTASATASYTLQLNSVNFVPSSASSLTVSLNGVIQKPDSSYTVSGSTLTFSSALTSSDSIDFIIAERGITLQTPSAGSVGTSQLASTAVTTAKIADDAVTKDKVSNLMYPAFEAYMSADTTISDNTWTKVPFNVEDFDTDNTYDNSTNFRFLPTVAGKYYVYSGIKLGSSVSNKQQSCEVRIYKNGAAWKESQFDPEDQRVTQSSIFVYSTMVLNGSSDYVEIFGKHNVVSSGGAVPRFDAGVGSCWFGAYRIGD